MCLKSRFECQYVEIELEEDNIHRWCNYPNLTDIMDKLGFVTWTSYGHASWSMSNLVCPLSLGINPKSSCSEIDKAILKYKLRKS